MDPVDKPQFPKFTISEGHRAPGTHLSAFDHTLVKAHNGMPNSPTRIQMPSDCACSVCADRLKRYSDEEAVANQTPEGRQQRWGLTGKVGDPHRRIWGTTPNASLTK